MLYAYLFIAIALFGSGYATAWKAGAEQISTLEAQIEISNHEAKRLLQQATAQTAHAEAEATVANIQLETEHAKNIESVTASAGLLGAVRMRIATKHPNCANTLSKGASAAITTDSTDTTELPTELVALLQTESRRCDQVMAWSEEAYQFISNNCGIKP